MYQGSLVSRRLATLATYRRVARGRPLGALDYLFFGRGEVDNFTYEIANGNEIAGLVASAAGLAMAQVAVPLREIDKDGELADGTRGQARAAPRSHAICAPRPPHRVVCTRSKATAAFDHREWSAHDGIGSSLPLRALPRNRDEGFEGRLLGLDINPQAGWLIPDNLLSGFELRVQHSVTALELLREGEEPDLFIDDSDHRYVYEMAEYRAVLPHPHDRPA
jgi:hypothetical protein